VTIVLAAVAVLLGAALQSATGFGFALVSAPILFALLGPREAVSAGAVLGVWLSSLTLATERRVPQVMRGEVLGLVAWSLPGLAIGALALRELPDRALSALVAAGVLAALGVRIRARAPAAEGEVRRVRPATVARGEGATGARAEGARVGGTEAREQGATGARAAGSGSRWWSVPAAGLSSGALSTATSLSGPPLVLHFVARGLSPPQMRDTLAAVFVALAALTAAALLVAGTFELARGLVVLLAAGLAGQLAGRRVFAWLAGGRHEDAVLGVLALTAVIALVSSAL
jgi:uncharacterized membrane protein YfcA